MTSTIDTDESLGRELELVAALRTGDEHVFEALVDRHSPSMVRVARGCVPTADVAEEVVQDTWIAFIASLDRFEGRCSVKTWLFSILLNLARSCGERERRCVSFSSLGSDEHPGDPDQTLPPNVSQRPSNWVGGASAPSVLPDDRLIIKETLTRLWIAIDALPERQRTVIVLRDVEGWTADEVCGALGVNGVCQRVLLHRARTRVRAAIAPYLTETVSVGN
jgi:RNA polymerase sigma-70 factor (ECF subfamily)